MFFQSVAILILVTAQNSVISAELNLNNIKSVQNFLDSLGRKSNSDYRLNYLLRNSENTRVLKLIFEDKQQVFDELANISTTLKYSSHKSEWKNLMRSIKKFEVPGWMYDSYYLHTTEDELDFLQERIELSIKAFRSVGHIDDEQDVEYFCKKGYPIANLFLEQLHHESVHSLYLSIIGIVRDKMEFLMNTQEVVQDHCGQSTSFRKALHDYYQLFMLVNIKFVTLKFFNWATFTRCANTPVKNGMRWVSKEVENAKKMIDYTKRIMNVINHYVYTCEPLDYERKYENIDIELKNMMKPVMIEEKNIITTQNCDHRCDINLINKARILENECKEYRYCTYVSENTIICSVKEQERLNNYLFKDVHQVVYANNDSLFKDTKSLNAEYEIKNSDCGFCLCTCISKPSKTRKVIAALSFREQVSDINNNKTEMVLEQPDNPSEPSNNPPDSKTNQFVKFRTTDWCKDFGARTVPFFNGQTVRFVPMTALGGVGIFHRGITGYGGYLALRVFDLNPSKFMNSELI
ncbi:hypothetical protein KQX54_007742 [Cotesia glomerata]|uniref:Uncharacterized protein n=1 Tax=Cotesia glomerata TaxID=32391 RepID=A0AAV7HWQ4_COTGL|nr:hypothetical protein KQX54_007742 [Cotesia glomerata]